MPTIRAMRWIRRAIFLAIPLALAMHFWIGRTSNSERKPWEPIATFVLAAIGVIPLAQLMGVATEQLAERTGPTWGGLLNASFGNAAELIIGIVALTKGLTDIVKASLTGSILGNLLLVAGAAMVAGGWKRERQRFSRAGAEASAGLLAVAVTAMLFPAIFHLSYSGRDSQIVEHEIGVSIGTSVILLIAYGAGLLFTLKTHAHIFSPAPALTDEHPPGISASGRWSVRRSVVALLVASVGVAMLAELLAGSVELMAHTLGWNQIFVGVIVLAIVGNAAEHSTALMLAIRNDMDTAMAITYQSSIQIALFATPVLVLISMVLPVSDHGRVARMDLIFTPMEVAVVLLTVGIVVIIGINGETNWFEGVLLLAVYAILAITFFYIPVHHAEGYDPGREPTHHAVTGERTGTP